LRLLRSLKRLGHHPYPDGVTTKKLKTVTKRPLYRLRVGDFRVLYEIENEHVYVLRIVKREDLDQAIRQMFRI
jgi:mRNA-degrading endonuclease RelE of RelBE toxin-antitoxin system